MRHGTFLVSDIQIVPTKRDVAAWRVISIVLPKRTLDKLKITKSDGFKEIADAMGSDEVATELLEGTTEL